MRKPIPFGKYFLLERINVGGMAEVFRAKTLGVEGFQKIVAIKRILPNIAEDEEFTTMFIDEAKIAVQLTHANVAQIFDLGKIGESYFIALEYVHGKDLRAIFDRLREQRARFSAQQAAFIAAKICEGLDYAHNKRDVSGQPLNIVHRDVSPQNILLSYEGEVKIVDFGIAKAANKASKTQAGILKGKFGYMSPEQVRGLELDRRSDVFSVGIILFETLTGERLFKGESDYSTLEKVRNVEMVPPTALVPSIPKELERIVIRALTKDREQRYQTTREIYDDLNRFLFSFEAVFSREDLAAFMHRHFADEFREETEQLKRETERVEKATEGPKLRPTARIRDREEPAPTPVVREERPAPRAVVRRGSGRRAAEPVRAPSPKTPRLAPLTEQDGPTATEEVDYPELAPLTEQDGPTSVDEPEVEAPRRRPGRLPSLELRDDGTGASEVVRPEPVIAERRSLRGVLVVGAVIAVALAVFGLLSILPAGETAASATLTPLVVTSAPADVRVRLDGEVVARLTPFRTDLPVGTYALSVEKQGFHPFEKQLVVTAKEAIVIEAVLERIAEANATLAFRSTPPGASIYLDGHRLDGVTPHIERHVVPGEHQVRIAREGYQEEVRTVLVEANQAKRLNATLSRLGATLRVRSRPPGATILLDGRKKGRTTPTTFDTLPSGAKVKVLLRKAGYQEWWREVVFDGFDVKTVNPRLEPAPATAPPPSRVERAPASPRRDAPTRRSPSTARREAAPAPAPTGELATVNINVSNGWAHIFIDGKARGHTPSLGLKLAPGSHNIRLVDPKDSNRARVFRIRLKPGETRTFIKELR